MWDTKTRLLNFAFAVVSSLYRNSSVKSCHRLTVMLCMYDMNLSVIGHICDELELF
jgi:hypothetical protein